MATRPEVGGINPVTMRMVVDLPAPLGPRKPSTSPRSTEKEIPSTARFGPNVFTRFSTLIMPVVLKVTAGGMEICSAAPVVKRIPASGIAPSPAGESQPGLSPFWTTQGKNVQKNFAPLPGTP